MTLVLREGYDAMAAAAVDCGCRFFAGYPMLPFTGLLDAFARELPRTGGVLIQADTEIEGVNMALGAAATGARAATGSTGQGVALMQETIAEAALNELPIVVFNVAPRPAGLLPGDARRRLGRLPHDHARARRAWSRPRSSPRLAFELADKWLTPVHLLRRPHDRLHPDDRRAASPAGAMQPQPEKPWALDGSSGGTGRSKVIWTWRQGKHNTPGPGPNRHWQSVAEKYDQVAEVEARHVARHTDDAEVVVVSFGTTGAFVDYVVDELRADGHRIGTFRPVTLWPFPSEALAAVAGGDACRLVLVYELNAGQMIDDVRLAVERRTSGARASAA